MLSTDIINFFSLNVICPTSINFCVLMAAIPYTASIFGLIIAVFFFTLKKPFNLLNVVAFYLFMIILIYVLFKVKHIYDLELINSAVVCRD